MTEETINEYVIKLTGKASLPQSLEIGKNYLLETEGSITTSTLSDNQDGTFTQYFRFEPVLIKLVSEKGESIKAKDPRSMSKKLRSVLWREWQEANINENFENYYEQRMGEIIQQIIG